MSNINVVQSFWNFAKLNKIKQYEINNYYVENSIKKQLLCSKFHIAFEINKAGFSKHDFEFNFGKKEFNRKSNQREQSVCDNCFERIWCMINLRDRDCSGALTSHLRGWLKVSKSRKQIMV